MKEFVGAVVVLHAETPLHPGAGTSLGARGLPVQAAAVAKAAPESGKVLVTGPRLVANNGSVVLEEYELKAAQSPEARKLAQVVAQRFLPKSEAYGATRARFEESFCIVPDDDFTYF